MLKKIAIIFHMGFPKIIFPNGRKVVEQLEKFKTIAGDLLTQAASVIQIDPEKLNKNMVKMT